ncbi:MAG: FkbM family methyltransferase [Rhodospirillales bacterium]|jgi:FkbM family methyltransferase|nr:FkbM family methyltransferase [Rhodospirillales bacterium]HJO72037.1 FkbM family methyltransferase [Rhodospirillales bacterium]
MQNFIFRCLRYAERKLQRLQGKGYGGRHSITTEIRAARRFLPAKDATVFDVGANTGTWSRALLAEAGGRIKSIYAFEPSAHNFAAIKEIGDERVRLVPHAVGEAVGQQTLHYDRVGSGLASLHERRLDHFGIDFSGRETVDVTTIDDFVAENGLDTIDFAKFDIEGHELAALRGATHTLEQGKIKALAFEFGGCNIDSRTYFQDFWYALGALGYRIYVINPLFGTTRLKAYDERHEVFLTTNFIAALNQPR